MEKKDEPMSRQSSEEEQTESETTGSNYRDKPTSNGGADVTTVVPVTTKNLDESSGGSTGTHSSVDKPKKKKHKKSALKRAGLRSFEESPKKRSIVSPEGEQVPMSVSSDSSLYAGMESLPSVGHCEQIEGQESEQPVAEGSGEAPSVDILPFVIPSLANYKKLMGIKDDSP